jgi:hypothetical protein
MSEPANEVTGEEVLAAMKAANITEVEHHDCGGCGYMTKYLRDGDSLFFDPGCWCSRYGAAYPEPREWSNASDWINMQTREDVRNKLRVRFGLLPREIASA